MSIEEALAGALLADMAVAALVGNHIYPLVAAQTLPLTQPYITYGRVSGSPEHTHDGVIDLWNAVISFECHAARYAEAKAVAAAIRYVIDGYRGDLYGVAVGKVLCVADVDFWDADTRRFGVATDFSVMYNE